MKDNKAIVLAIASLALQFIMMNIFPNTAFASTLINESFESYEVGPLESNEEIGINVKKGFLEEIVITENKFSDGTKSLFMDGKVGSSQRLEVEWPFPEIDGNKSVYLSFDIYRSTIDLLEIYLEGKRTGSTSVANGPSIRFDQYKRIVVNVPKPDGSGAETKQICLYDLETWYRVTIIIDEISQGKYDIIIKPLTETGETITGENYDFRFPLDNISQFRIYNYSAAKGSQYIDNIVLIEDYTNFINNISVELYQDFNSDGVREIIDEPVTGGALANDENLEIEVSIFNLSGEPIAGKTLSLISSRGDDDVIFPLDKGAGPGTTNSIGTAYFQLCTRKASTISGREPARISVLDDQTTEVYSFDINFNPALSLENSQLVLKTAEEDIVANDLDEHAIEVQLKDFEGLNMIYSDNGPWVKLFNTSFPNSIITITPEEINANNNGLAGDFFIKSAHSGVIEIGALIDGKALNPVQNVELFFASPVSDILELHRDAKLGVGLEKLPVEERPDTGAVPADGISYWEVQLKAIAVNDTVLAGEVIALSTADTGVSIEPNVVTTDDNGMAFFNVAYLNPELGMEEIIQIDLKVDNSIYQKTLQYKFIKDSWGPICLERFPRTDLGESMETTDPIWVGFNKTVDLSSATIRLVPRDDQGNVISALIVSNDAVDPSLGGELKQIAFAEYPQISQSNTLYFKPNRKLKTNLIYAIEISSVKDLAGNELNSYDLAEWEISCIDTSPPKLVSSTPNHEERNVDISLEVITLEFNEELGLDGGHLIGTFMFEDMTGGKVVTLGNATFKSYNYNEELERAIVEIQLPVMLESDRYYRLKVHGICDVVGSGIANSIPENEPETILFKTIDTRPPIAIERYPESRQVGIPYKNLVVLIRFDEWIVENPVSFVIIQKVDSNGQDMGSAMSGLLEFSNVGVVGELKALFTDLDPDTEYKITVNGIYDEAGFDYNESWNFHTAAAQLDFSDPFFDGEQYIITAPVSDMENIFVYIPKAVYSPELDLEIHKIAEAEILQLLQGTSQGHSGTAQMFDFISSNKNFSDKLTFSLPFVLDSNGKVEVLTSSGERDYVESNQLYAAYHRSWAIPNGATVGEWVPLPTKINAENGQLEFQTDVPGKYAIFASPVWKSKKLIQQLTLTANPFVPGSGGLRGETTFKFNLAQDSKITLTIYDSQGRLVATLLSDEIYHAGYQGFSWDGTVNGTVLRSGLYVYRLFARTFGGDNPDVGWVSGALGIKN